MSVLKPFRAQKRMKQLMSAHFQSVSEASRDPERKVAWCTSVGPAELLHSFGFEVYYPENHGALLGASRKASDYIPRANAIGYSPDICSYLTSDVGAFLAGETPLLAAYGVDAIPRPDVLVYNTNQCRDVHDWFSYYARTFNAPLLGINSPTKLGEITADHVAALVAQYRALVAGLEQVSGRPFDLDRFRYVLGLSAETTRLWKEVLWAARRRPSPLSFFDASILMGPAVVLRGTTQAVEFYHEVLAELTQRIEDGVSAVEGETHRLYWEGMPIWGRLREQAGFFQELKSSVVVSTYCNSWVFDAFDPAEPLESLARAYLELFVVRSDESKEATMAELLQTFAADGVVYHEAKTCPYNSNTRYGLPQRLKERAGIPFVTLYGDLNDLRCFSDEQAKTSLEAFVEQLQGTSRG